MNDNGGSGDSSVKKRSLSSYLSNMSSRKEELEKIKKRQKEGQLAEQQQQQEEKQRQITEKLRREDDLSKEAASIREAGEEGELNPARPQAAKENAENANQFKLEDDQTQQSQVSSSQDIKRGNGDTDEAGDEEPVIQSPDKSRTPNTDDQVQEPKNGTLYRKDLQTMLKEPAPHRKPRNLTSSESDSTDAVEKIKNEDEDEDVDSDAPTEPASPPKPRRGRLIRGDRLPSMSPSHSTFDNDSDSELSDIDELRSVHISSSIIHGDSSPSKVIQEHHRRTRQPSSPRLDRRTSASPRHFKPQVAIPKNSKIKKGVYRDAGGRTKLQISCDKGNYELAKRLIEEEDYDVNDQDNAGNTALHEAALNGHLDLVKLLTKNGANVNIQSFEMFRDTPLIDASANGHLDVVKYLLLNGADPTKCNAKGLTAYESIEEDSDLDDQEREIVHEIKRHLRSATRKWKDKKKIRGEPIEKGKLSDRHVVRRRSEELLGDFEFFWTDVTSRAGKEKLFRASKEGNLAYVGAYLENGGRVDLKSFLEAVKFGHEDITSLFLAFGAQVNAILKDGATPLISAVGRGHGGTVKLLLDAGADPTRKDRSGHAALYYAENSPMGVVDSDEISLIKKALDRAGVQLGDRREEEPASSEVEHENRQGMQKTEDPESGKISEEEEQEEEEEEESEGDDDDENIVSIARKRRTISPDRLDVKRQAILSQTLSSSVTDEPSDHVESNSAKIAKQEPDTIKVHEETPEEKEQRMKAEEEYIQRRLQNKRRKEQELLKKLALDEEKREKEKAEQRIQEAEKLKAEERQRTIEMSKKKKEAELARRREIRSRYPLGLKLIDFSNTDDVKKFLPLYYIEVGNERTKFVLDLQMYAVTRDIELLSNEESATQNRLPVNSKHKKQLWNILKFIFLNGGNDPENHFTLNLEENDLEMRMEYELREFTKFSSLPMCWINLEDIYLKDESQRQYLMSDMVPIALIDSADDTVVGSSSKEPVKNPNLVNMNVNISECVLPNKFQKRHDISCLLQNYNAVPLW